MGRQLLTRGPALHPVLEGHPDHAEHDPSQALWREGVEGGQPRVDPSRGLGQVQRPLRWDQPRRGGQPDLGLGEGPGAQPQAEPARRPLRLLAPVTLLKAQATIAHAAQDGWSKPALSPRRDLAG